MRCTAHRSSPLPSLSFPFQQQHTKLKLPPPMMLDFHRRSSSSRYGFYSGAPSSLVSVRSNATVNDLLSLPVTKSHPKPGDIYVFLQTGGVLLFAYWIANFVVPNWISKSMGYDDKMGENQDSTTKPKDEEGDTAAEEEEEEEKVSSLSQKRGFGSSSRRKSRR